FGLCLYDRDQMGVRLAPQRKPLPASNAVMWPLCTARGDLIQSFRSDSVVELNTSSAFPMRVVRTLLGDGIEICNYVNSRNIGAVQTVASTSSRRSTWPHIISSQPAWSPLVG